MKKLLLTIAMATYGLLAFVPGAWAEKNPSQGNGSVPTFNNEVVRIFQNNCQTCHHPGDIAPFSLMTYADAAPRANAIMRATQNRIMPPWKPADDCGEFQGTRRLSEKDIDILARWAEAGAPEGDPADLPPPLEFPDGWSLGQEPDVAMDSGVDYVPDRMRTDDYHCFTLPTNFSEDRYISTVDIQPGNRGIVHHVILYVDPTGASARLEQTPGAGYTCFGGPGPGVSPDILGVWAPGARPRFLPDNVGVLVPGGDRTRIVMQVHYNTRGEAQADRTRLGMYFSGGPVDKRFYMVPIVNPSFRIPPNDPHYRVTASITLPPDSDIHGLSIAPHMHLLGREMEIRATLPGGEDQCLINIPDWDFNWQNNYFFGKSQSFPSGTRINLTAYYDNSEGNPRQPSHPPVEVRWGERTVDEMCLAFLGITIDAEQLGSSRWTKSRALEDLLQPVMVMGGFVDEDDPSGDHSHHSFHHQ